VQDRIWYEQDDAFAFLVKEPLTFGHAQLIVAVDRKQLEEDSFRITAVHIGNCIRAFRELFTNPVLEQWPEYREYTLTSGKHIKTLVMRASANEELGEYKVHLVPYFQSHLDETKRLYRENLKTVDGKGGGLLYWVGKRERLVDRDSAKDKDSHDELVTSFSLPKLAQMLNSDG